MPDDLTSPSADLAFMTIAEAARQIENKQLSPVELTTALIRRAEALDPQLDAYLLPTFERALDQARAAEREIAGRQLSRADARHPVRPQGHLCDGRHPHHRALPDLHRHRPRRRRDDGAPSSTTAGRS